MLLLLLDMDHLEELGGGGGGGGGGGAVDAGSTTKGDFQALRTVDAELQALFNRFDLRSHDDYRNRTVRSFSVPFHHFFLHQDKSREPWRSE